MASALAPAFLVWILLLFLEKDSARNVAILVFLFALVFACVLGVPTAWWLRRKGWFRLHWMALAGAAVGYVPILIASIPRDRPGVSSSVNGVDLMVDGKVTPAAWLHWPMDPWPFALAGFIGAIAFYGVYRAIARDMPTAPVQGPQ
ncbi:hypothetical protein LVB87_05790 [Lysobacter sp. KIS68-7]|uniref:hypothetical protein n=1 Tax=Lysobacter sp. KIS68-7 TaxID=2904252 RepID=UPI001E3D2F1B|nr:hypothetical protein [Lysobacter sp. KIS68-7]UHQ20653.1 hypothetical protein LVB87_05790 [Lysobacter sp. KIS68-7]